jgi:hypothetical membrane protein
MNHHSVRGHHPSARSRQRKIRAGAIMWIAGPVQYLVAQLVVQSAWRTPYSWRTNPLSDLGAVRCQHSSTPLPRYVCSPLHGILDASMITLGLLLAGGVLLTACCWGHGLASRGARSLLIVAAAGILGIGVGNAGFILAGLVTRTSPVGRLWPVALPLGLVAMAATVLMFGGYTSVTGFGGMERLAVYPLRGWLIIAGISLLHGQTQGTHPPAPQQARSAAPASNQKSPAD